MVPPLERTSASGATARAVGTTNNNQMKQFRIILSLVLILQLPGCIVVLADDAGQIEHSGNEKMINASEFATALFSFPLHYVLRDNLGSNGLALVVYSLNLILLSLMIHVVVKGFISVRQAVRR